MSMMTEKIEIRTPSPLEGETPTAYAERIGRWYCAAISAERQKSHGLYLTPACIAEFMASLSTSGQGTVRVLDPACGVGILLSALVEKAVSDSHPPSALELTAWEIDRELVQHLREVLRFASEWAACRGLAVCWQVQEGDFILDNSTALAFSPMLSPYIVGDQGFDLVIANPPYFKLPKSDPRSVAALHIVHGQPNIYALFMAIAIKMLKHGGEFVFITPRSFASGPYFRLFREKFFDILLPQQTHVFGSRKDAFSRDEVLQENIILKGVCHPGWFNEDVVRFLTVTASQGANDITKQSHRRIQLAEALDMESQDRVLRLPTTEDESGVIALVHSWTSSLERYGLKISTGPVVPFRAEQFLATKEESRNLPLLWMNHVHAMSIHWPNGVKKPQYIKPEASLAGLLVPNRNYVLLRRFSAKEQHRRLMAAPYLASEFDTNEVGLENHLNYIYRPGGTLSEDEAWGLSGILNSVLLDTYFRVMNGNTQVSATEVRAMPLPDIALIRKLGRNLKARDISLEEVDELLPMYLKDVVVSSVTEKKRVIIP